MAALLVLRDKDIKPLLAAAQRHRRSPQSPAPLDIDYKPLVRACAEFSTNWGLL
ncbi:MAG TPA: hypothetical protein VN901_05130 [Candidatus Acidoferrales bacterium]|nr:hypothetical protein [Candidatus Acidoferrales bacterium]